MSDNALISFVVAAFIIWLIYDNGLSVYKEREFAKAGLQQCVVHSHGYIKKVWMKDCPKVEELNDEGGDSAEDKV